MKDRRFVKSIWSAVVAAALFAVCSTSALAQCAMCRAAFNGSNGAALAKSLNQGIIVLLIPPVAIFCAIFITVIKYRKAADDNSRNSL